MKTKTIAGILIIVIAAVGISAAAWIFFVAPKPNPYDVAIVFATGGLGDKSFNDGCYQGAIDARTEFTQFRDFTYVEPTEIAEYEAFHRAFASHQEWIEPYALIIGIGFDQADAIQAVAADFPEQKWAIVDMWINDTTYPNVASLLFNEHEGSALVGAIAGLMTETGKLGFVGGMSIPLIWKFAAGYFWGANLTRPSLGITPTAGSVNTSVGYTNDWVDIAAGETLADAMYAAGVDIIFGAAGRSGLGVISSCKENNATLGPIWYIGVDSPQMYLGTADPDNPVAPTVGLTSMLKRVDVAVHDIIEDVLVTDSFVNFNLFTLANGGLGYEVNTALLILPPSIITEVENIKADIISGTLVVPQDYDWVH